MDTKKIQLGEKTFLPVGFGPGVLGYSAKYKKQKSGISWFLDRVYTHLITRPLQEREYKDSVVKSLKAGYRLIDHSSAYGAVPLIGDAIRQSGVPREDIILTTRISNRAQMGGAESVRKEFLWCLEKYGVEYIDILMFHWPVTGVFIDTWKVMEQLKDEGLVRHLGVANCHKHHIEDILDNCKYRPEIGQFEIHPLFTQKALIDYYKLQGIIVEAYTPTARFDDRIIRLPCLKEIEKKYQKALGQIILRWHIQNGCIPLVRSYNPQHIKENLDIFDFSLSDEEMKIIDSININSRLRYDPDNCDFRIL